MTVDFANLSPLSRTVEFVLIGGVMGDASDTVLARELVPVLMQLVLMALGAYANTCDIGLFDATVVVSEWLQCSGLLSMLDGVISMIC